METQGDETVPLATDDLENQIEKDKLSVNAAYRSKYVKRQAEQYKNRFGTIQSILPSKQPVDTVKYVQPKEIKKEIESIEVVEIIPKQIEKKQLKNTKEESKEDNELTLKEGEEKNKPKQRLRQIKKSLKPEDYIRKLENISSLSYREQIELLTTPIPKYAETVSCSIKRYKDCLKYELLLSECMEVLMTAKKRSWKLTKNYLITVDHGNVDKKTEGFIGKLRANFWESEYNIYDDGDDPIKCKDSTRYRENLGAIIYEKKWINSKSPKSFEVLTPKLEGDERIKCIPTSDKDNLIGLKNKGVLGNMVVMHNKKPKWNDNIKAYVLNFHGKVRIPSIKNFILTDKEEKENYLILGKADDNLYNMDVKWPLSLYQAFCICISSISD